jgi:hypothetical protein
VVILAEKAWQQIFPQMTARRSIRRTIASFYLPLVPFCKSVLQFRLEKRIWAGLENKGPKKAELIDVILVRNGERNGNNVKSALELENNSKP